MRKALSLVLVAPHPVNPIQQKNAATLQAIAAITIFTFRFITNLPFPRIYCATFFLLFYYTLYTTTSQYIIIGFFWAFTTDFSVVNRRFYFRFPSPSVFFSLLGARQTKNNRSKTERLLVARFYSIINGTSRPLNRTYYFSFLPSENACPTFSP